MSWRNRDVAAGLVFIGIGGFAAVAASRYGMNFGTRTGAGVFPSAAGVFLALVGIIQVLISVRPKVPAPPFEFHWRPILLVVLAVAIFGLLVQRIGAVPSLLLTTVITSLAGGRPRARDIVIVYGLAIAFVYFFLVKFVGMAIPLFW